MAAQHFSPAARAPAAASFSTLEIFESFAFVTGLLPRLIEIALPIYKTRNSGHHVRLFQLWCGNVRSCGILRATPVSTSTARLRVVGCLTAMNALDISNHRSHRRLRRADFLGYVARAESLAEVQVDNFHPPLRAQPLRQVRAAFFEPRKRSEEYRLNFLVAVRPSVSASGLWQLVSEVRVVHSSASSSRRGEEIFRVKTLQAEDRVCAHYELLPC